MRPADGDAWAWLPFGEEAMLLRWQGPQTKANGPARGAQAALCRSEPSWDVIVGADSVLCVAPAGQRIEESRVRAALEASAVIAIRGRVHKIPTCYDGPDLHDVARLTGLSPDAVIHAHAGNGWNVEFLGFLPGFAYLGEAPSVLQLPRRAEPRTRVARGSVGLAARYCGIYPTASPGGWQLIGRSLGSRLFDPEAEQNFLLQPGDEVRFEPMAPGERADPEQLIELRFPLGKAERFVTVESALGMCTIQDAGRPGLLHRGVAPSGPLDPVLWERTQRAVGNGPGHACLELFRGSARFRLTGEHWASVNGASARRIRDGESISVASVGRPVSYLAFAGGLNVPPVLGSRSTWVAAHWGGCHGRPVRRGDWFASRSAECPRALWPSEREPDLWDGSPFETIGIEPGPDLELFGPTAWERLLSSTYEVTDTGDRTGLRLLGAPLLRSGEGTNLSLPVRSGALQVPKSGQPIAFGPDHPVTGGYPVIGVVRRAERAKLYQQVSGQRVQWLSAL